MRLFRKYTNVCQNCLHCNNEKGKHIPKWYSKTIGHYDDGSKIIKDWNIFCERLQKFKLWDKYKLCFIDRKMEKRD